MVARIDVAPLRFCGLQAQLEANIPPLIGYKVQRYWPEEGQWWEGVITDYRERDGLYWCGHGAYATCDMLCRDWAASDLLSCNRASLAAGHAGSNLIGRGWADMAAQHAACCAGSAQLNCPNQPALKGFSSRCPPTWPPDAMHALPQVMMRRTHSASPGFARLTAATHSLLAYTRLAGAHARAPRLLAAADLLFTPTSTSQCPCHLPCLKASDPCVCLGTALHAGLCLVCFMARDHATRKLQRIPAQLTRL